MRGRLELLEELGFFPWDIVDRLNKRFKNNKNFIPWNDPRYLA